MSVALLAVPLVLLMLDVPIEAVLGATVLVLGLLVATRSHRGRRRHERARRRAEHARWAADARRRQRVEHQARRRAYRRHRIKERTGVDVDVVERLVRDVTGRGQAAVRATGERVTEKLEKRYPPPAGPAAPRQLPGANWLDLDADLAAMQSKARTEELLRLTRLLDANQQVR